MQVYRKLLLLDLQRLDLIKMFLYFMKIDEGEQARRGLERMQRKMHSAVDMALVTILAHYDSEHRRASRAGELLTTAASTPRVGGFLPHSMQEDRDDLSALPSASAGMTAQPMASGTMSMATSQPGMTQTNVVWAPSMDSTMGSAVSTIDKSAADATPTAADMSDVLEKFEEAAADVEKSRQLEKQAREEAAKKKESGEIEEQASPRRSPTAAAARPSSPLKNQIERVPKEREVATGAGTVVTADVTLNIQEAPTAPAAQGGSQAWPPTHCLEDC